MNNINDKYKLDYSKWDKIKVDSSSDEDEEDDGGIRPRVTRLEAPGSVTFGGSSPSSSNDKGGVSIADAAAAAAAASIATTETVQSAPLMPTPHLAVPSSDVSWNDTGGKTSVIPASWTEKGAIVRNQCSVCQKNAVDDDTAAGGKVPPENQPTTAESTTAVELSNNSNSHASNPTCARCSCYYWSQDRLSIILRFPLRHDNNTKNEKVEYIVSISDILPFSERFQAVSSHPQCLSIHACAGNATAATTTTKPSATRKVMLLLQGHLPHPVYLPEDEEETVDWSVERHAALKCPSKLMQLQNQQSHICIGGNDEQKSSAKEAAAFLDSEEDDRYIVVTMLKATPVPGMTLWWKKLFQEHDEEIPLTWLSDQQNGSSSFQRAWDEAHKQFIKDRQQSPTPKFYNSI